MWSEFLPVLGTIGGTMAGGLITYATGVRKSKVDLQVADRQAEVQLALADQQYQTQIETERAKQRHQKVEEAYGQLMCWLYDLEGVIDEVWAGVCTDDQDLITKVNGILREWPWETLRPPRDTAATQYYWSPEVRGLLDQFGGVSASFTSAASVALLERTHLDSQASESPVFQDSRHRTWEGRNQLRKITQDIRDRVRAEMTSPPPQSGL